MEKTYYCACEQKCKGVQRKVARATYHRHKEYRDRDRQNKYSPSMQAFLNAHPIILRTSSSRAVQRSRVHVSGLSEEDTEHPIGPSNKRARKSDVGTFLGIYGTMRTDPIRTIHLLIVLKVNLCSATHSWVIAWVLTRNLGDYQALPRISRALLNHLATWDLLDIWERWTP